MSFKEYLSEKKEVIEESKISEKEVPKNIVNALKKLMIPVKHYAENKKMIMASVNKKTIAIDSKDFDILKRNGLELIDIVLDSHIVFNFKK